LRGSYYSFLNFHQEFFMKMIKCFVRPVFLVVLVFGVTACVMMPGGGGPHGSGGGATTPHR
jgi:hypothetical protein